MMDERSENTALAENVGLAATTWIIAKVRSVAAERSAAHQNVGAAPMHRNRFDLVAAEIA